MTLVQLLLCLLAVIAALEVIAERFRLPLPGLLVAAGTALALIPGVPRPPLDPEAVFLVFVPPLLYWAALTASLRDLSRVAVTVSSLAIGLVIATTVAVAVVAHALVPELTWGAAFVLGAIVSPPDAVAAIAVTRHLAVPRRVVTVLEGESLINDATALVAYQVSVAAAVSGSFSLGKASVDFVVAGLGGVVVGLLVGVLVAWVRRLAGQTPTVGATISLLTPFAAFMPAEAIHASGVIAVVTIGVYLGRRGPRLISAQTRLQTTYMWRIVTFLLEGLIFLLVGLRLPLAFEKLEGHTFWDLLLCAALVSGAAIALRLAWVFPSSFLAYRLRALLGHALPRPPWSETLFTGLAGIRGGDSLVIALALPLTTASGAAFPGRPMIIYLSFVVIVVTLVLLGLALPLVARALGLRGEEAHRAIVEARARTALLNGVDTTAFETRAGVAGLRSKLITLWERGDIDDDAMRTIQGELDHAEALVDSRHPAHAEAAHG